MPPWGRPMNPLIRTGAGLVRGMVSGIRGQHPLPPPHHHLATHAWEFPEPHFFLVRAWKALRKSGPNCH